MTIKKPHLSASQLNMASMCGEAYRRRYIEGDKTPPAIPMLRGRGVHHAADKNFKQKIESHEDLPVTDIIDIAVSQFDTECSGGYSLTGDEVTRKASDVLDDARDDVAEFAELHAEMQAPDYQPEFVEQQFRIELPDSTHDFVGVIDLATTDRVIADLKTTRKSSNQDAADKSVQLTGYAAGYTAMTGNAPRLIQLDVGVVLKTKTKRDVFPTTRTADDFAELSARHNILLKAIETGTFMPIEPGHWKCSAKWCGFHPTCPYTQGVRSRARQND